MEVVGEGLGNLIGERGLTQEVNTTTYVQYWNPVRAHSCGGAENFQGPF